jgi:hypothetical protein
MEAPIAIDAFKPVRRRTRRRKDQAQTYEGLKWGYDPPNASFDEGEVKRRELPAQGRPRHARKHK